MELGCSIPTQIPDLIGVQDRRYLDHTGLVRHRGIGDVMRYAALNQAVDLYSRHGDFVPVADDFRTVPDPYGESPFPFANGRYSDEQLYALAQFIYSLQPPKNPTHHECSGKKRGQEVFAREGCGACHTPPLYTNNRLTPVMGFQPLSRGSQAFRHHAAFGGDGSRPRIENSSGHRLLQGAVAQRRLVSWTVRAQRLGGDAGRLVRPASSAR